MEPAIISGHNMSSQKSKRKIIAISGSLRTDSSNTSILKALQHVHDEAEVDIFYGLGTLPFFSPELDREPLTDSVKLFRTTVRESDGVVICTPEYAFGMPGVLKNALDWMVSSGELYDKPTITISASPLPSGGEKAHDSLRLTLTAMGAKFIEGGKLIIPAVKAKVNSEGKVIDQPLLTELKKLLDALVITIDEK